jgi:Calpain family cysteine protease
MLRVEELENRLVPATAVLTGGLQTLPIYTGPGSPTWFQANMSDPGIRSLAQADFTNHGSITRADMLAIFNEVASQGAITSPELNDLRFLVTNSTASVLHIADDVRFEANVVVSDYNSYQGTFVGNLQVGSSAAVLNEFVDKCFLGMDHPIASGAYTKVSGNLFVNGTPSYLNVHQGQLGDCWLLASLAEIAAREPSVIQNMFTYEGLHTEYVTTPTAHVPIATNVAVWEVHFYFANGNSCYETVDSMLPGGGTIYAQPKVTNDLGNGALWVALAEKAYVQANGDGYVNSQNTYDNAYAALNGGTPLWALSAIAGPNAPISISPPNVAAAWNAGDLIVMATGTTTASYDLVPKHAYAVVGYNANSINPFTVYNPWGTNAAGWAPYQYNGYYVYGKFATNQAFLTANFSPVNQTNAAIDTDMHLRNAYEAAIAEWLNFPATKHDRSEIVS